MRWHVHDFSGHPFAVQLSRELAGRGHDVHHVFSTQFVTGHGRLTVTADDPPSLRISGVTCRAPMVKYAPAGRVRFELAYARAWCRLLAADPADVVVACNVPLFALARAARWLQRHGRPWVLWHQDLYGPALGAEAERVLPAVLARPARYLLDGMERRQVRAAAGVIAIADAMIEQYRRWGVARDDVVVLPNWAPLEPAAESGTGWAGGQDLPAAALRLVYAGTLGRKHDPQLLLDLLDAVRARGVDASLLVLSQGPGADAVAAAAAGRSDVRVLPFQPVERLPAVLGACDVGVTVLEPDAARWSVPSKTLTYLAAGLPVVALVPQDNPAARLAAQAGGVVAPPTPRGAATAAQWLADAVADPGRLPAAGARARDLARRSFDVRAKADVVEAVLLRVAAAPRRAAGTAPSGGRAGRAPRAAAWLASLRRRAEGRPRR